MYDTGLYNFTVQYICTVCTVKQNCIWYPYSVGIIICGAVPLVLWECTVYGNLLQVYVQIMCEPLCKNAYPIWIYTYVCGTVWKVSLSSPALTQCIRILYGISKSLHNVRYWVCIYKCTQGTVQYGTVSISGTVLQDSTWVRLVSMYSLWGTVIH